MAHSSLRADDEWLGDAVDIINRGKVVALAYERLFGLAADAMNHDAVRAAVRAKGRASQESAPRPTAVIIPNREALSMVAAQVPPLAAKLMDRYWPGPVTILLPAVKGLSPFLLGPSQLVGVRLPGPCPAATLSERTGKILTASSANPTGGEDPLVHSDIVPMDSVELVIPGTVPGPPGSTVVDGSGRRPVVLREGAVNVVEVLKP